MDDIVTITDNAKEQLIVLRSEEGLGENDYLRISVKGGGCSGFLYDLSFTDDYEDNDMLYTENGIDVVIDNKSLLYLLGVTLDYTSGLNGKGFEFGNPNATRSCGCGESFSV
jgi:iron-sulfur cluster assembly protein